MSKGKSQSLYDFFYTLNPILFTIAFILFSLYLNEIVIRFRMQEFDLGLRSLSNKENVNHSSNILAKIKSIRNRRENPEAEDSDLKNEIKYHTLASQEIISPMNIEFNTADRLVIQMIQGLRFILGKNVKVLYDEGNTSEKIEEAYFYERARKYNTAINIYGNLLKNNWPLATQSTLHLHMGFCEAMVGDYSTAMKTLKKIMDHPDLEGTENWKTAWKLHKELELLGNISQALNEQELSDLEKGKELFKMGNHQKASVFLEKYINSNPRGNISEGLYYLGRSKEDRGDYDEALKYYSQILRKWPESLWAQKANRRIYVMGKFYSKNDKLADIAERNSKLFGDSALIQELEVFEKIEENKVPLVRVEPAAPAQDSAQGTTPDSLSRLPVSVDSIKAKNANRVQGEVDSVEIRKAQEVLNILDSIHIPDLTNLYEEEILVSVVERGKQESPQAQPEARAEERPQLNDPIRSAQIFNVVKARGSELQYTYDKYRRKGMVGSGRLTLKILITPEGMVKGVEITKIDSDILNQHFENEITDKVKNWKFMENLSSREDVSFSFPVSFVARDIRGVRRK